MPIKCSVSSCISVCIGGFIILLLFLVSALDCSLFVRILFLVCFSFSGFFSTFAIQNQ